MKEEIKHVRVLSLGAGVQSSTMALMAAHGEIERPDYIIFSDTGWEPKRVYEWLDWLKVKLAEFDMEVVIAQKGNIRDDLLNAVGGAKDDSFPSRTSSKIPMEQVGWDAASARVNTKSKWRKRKCANCSATRKDSA